MKMKYLLLLLIGFMTVGTSGISAKSTRVERRAITEGNALVKEGKLAEGIKLYKQALNANPESNVAAFNLGLTQINLSKGMQNNDTVSKQLLSEGTRLMQSLTGPSCENTDLRSKANYNMGNLAFESEDYAGAIRYYKQALRLNPDFADARRNLRIAQLKQQNQDNQDQQNNQNNQDQQDQQNQQNQEDQQQDQQNQQNQQEQEQPKDNELNNQTAEQILNAVENNENQTRMRQATNQGAKAKGSSSGNMRKW